MNSGVRISLVKLIYGTSLVLLLVCLVLRMPVLCMAKEIIDNSLPLQAGVSHTEVIPPVEKLLRPGVKFDEKNVPELSGEEQWFWIPKWFAGKFIRNTETHYTAFGPMTMKSRSVSAEQRGHQLDANGEIWNYSNRLSPFQVEASKYVCFMIPRQYQFLTITRDKIVLRALTTKIYYWKRNRKIFKVTQDVDIQVKTPKGPGTYLTEETTKVYDMNGKFKKSVDGYYLSTLVSDFQQIENYQGVDLKTSLEEHFKKMHWEYLIPNK